MSTIYAKINTELYKTEITSSSGLTIVADEPVTMGGKNLGLNPKELLASSLASCTLITLRMYIDRKAWNVSTIDITIDLTQDADQKSTTFNRIITFTGALDEKQKQRLETVANSCPIHKILSNTIQINTTLK